MSKEIYVLIVDDEKKILYALKDFLGGNGYKIITANNGEEALEIFYEKNKEIDIILLDVMMPKVNGFEVLREIREYSKTVPIIMLTAKGEEYDQLTGFKYGADDYMCKPFSPTLLLARIEAVLKRTGKGGNGIVGVGDLKIDTLRKQVFKEKEIVELTPKEYDLLLYFIINKKIPLTREQILNEVWGFNYDGEVRTVDTHVKQLRAKLLDKGELIKTIHKVGYLFNEE